MKKFLIIIFTCISVTVLGQTYKSFEVREITKNEKANGETDFKGSTEVLDTEGRISFLKYYSKVASSFFNDKNLDYEPVPLELAKFIKNRIKPQPLPNIRLRQQLDSFKYIGYSFDKNRREIENLKFWKGQNGVVVRDNKLLFEKSTTIKRSFDVITWRGRIEFSLKTFDSKVLKLNLGEKVFISDLELSVGIWNKIDIEIDLASAERGYNVFVNGVKIVDYALINNLGSIDFIAIHAASGTEIDDIIVTKYGEKKFGEDLHDRDVPYTVNTVLYDSFQITPDPKFSNSVDYDDSEWALVDEMPYAYGGERYKGERLYLRSTFDCPSNFPSKNRERAILNIEAIFPSGEVWVNDKVVHVSKKPTPIGVDITDYLHDGQNIISIVVDPNQVKVTNRHTATDIYTGWYTGRVWIDYTSLDHIEDVYIVTDSVEQNNAKIFANILLNTERWLKNEREVKIYNGFKGYVKVEFFEWFPNEFKVPIAVEESDVDVELYEDKILKLPVLLENAKLWNPEKPQLYKVVVTLLDENKTPIDDYVLTTGVRKISQINGTFCINNEPYMMNGALILGHRAPLENISRHMYCAPSYILVQDLLKIKKMNGNTIRMSHHDQQWGGTNDPRYAEYADQLGVMFQWATPAWVRSGSPWLLDFKSLPQYVHQLRNHPSIVMWQPANHPKVGSTLEESMKWFEKVYTTIWQVDSTRLISPTANQIRMHAPSDDGKLTSDGKPAKPYKIWTAPMITRGNMDHMTGYGANWEILRNWPYTKKWSGEQGWRENANRTTYLKSKERAYFDFENEESIAQPNWELMRGKPEYKIMSYEWDADKGSIGRLLTTEEWRESQAFQAMSAFEAIKKKRILDYDGFAWCELNGGGNSGTYLKPLLDYYGHAKLSYHVLGMAYQKTFACSDNVDMAYGPDDKVNVIIVYWGEAGKGDVSILIRDDKNKIVKKKKFSDIFLPLGRGSISVGQFKVDDLKPGVYTFEYELKIK